VGSTLGAGAVNTSTHKEDVCHFGLAVGTGSITAVYTGNTNRDARTLSGARPSCEI